MAIQIQIINSIAGKVQCAHHFPVKLAKTLKILEAAILFE